METEITANTEKPVPVFIALDYAGSDNAGEIDRGIRETIKGIRISILAMGLGLANIQAKGLYRDLGCPNITQYIQKLSAETKMTRSNILNWLCMGKVFLKYKNELELAGFSESDGPTKLPYLERALKINEKQEVFDSIKNMSVEEFASFAKGQTAIDIPAGNSRRWVVSEKGNCFYVDGKLAIIMSGKADRTASSYFKKVIRAACEALVKRKVIVPVHVRNMSDARRFEDAAERLKKEMGMN